MKTAFSFIFLLTISILYGSRVKAQSWQWGISNTPVFNGVVEAAPTTVDVNGNVFCAGSLLLADSITIGTYTIYDTGGYDEIIIAKADPAGNVSWVVNSYNEFSELNCMITDANGNLYVMGQYYDSSFKMGTTVLLNDSVDYPMQFLVKLSPAGNVIWARNIAGGAFNHTGGLGIDQYANVYVAGSFGRPTAVIGTYTLTNTSPGGDTTDIYIAKYDYMGNPIWAKSFGGSNNEHPTGMAVTKDGTIFLTGLFTSQTMTIGSDILVDSMFYSGGLTPFQYPFFAKFDSGGNPIWAKDIARHISPNELKADAEKNIYITGFIDSSIILGIDTLTLVGTRNALVAKYDSNGNLSWANSASAISYTTGYGIDIDSCSNVWVAGSTDGMMNFNGHILDTLPVGADKVFIAAYDHCGKYIVGSGTQLGSGGDDGMGMALDQRGNLYIGGDYEDIQFVIGPDTLQQPPAAREYFFIAKYTYGPMPCSHVACCYASPIAAFTDTSSGTTYSFSYTGTSPYDSIRWDFGDGSTSTSASPTHTYSVGSFTACIIVYTPCGVDSFCKDISILPEPVANASSSGGVSTYPNPAANEYTINNSTGFPDGTKACIYDVTGRLINIYTLAKHKTVINVSGFAPGSYQCRINTGNGTIVKKLVVIH